LVLDIGELIVYCADCQQTMSYLIKELLHSLIIQEFRIIIDYLEERNSILLVEMKHIVIEQVEVKIDFTEALNSRS
jgi:hypothetical protein